MENRKADTLLLWDVVLSSPSLQALRQLKFSVEDHYCSLYVSPTQHLMERSTDCEPDLISIATFQNLRPEELSQFPTFRVSSHFCYS